MKTQTAKIATNTEQTKATKYKKQNENQRQLANKTATTHHLLKQSKGLHFHS
jgi:hypothetical protein